MSQVYPAQALRQLALHCQHLDEPLAPAKPVTQADLLALVRQLGCIQIDTLQMVQRSHYLVPWSRLGNYAVSDLDAQLNGTGRTLFEGWMKAACFIPVDEYRYQMPYQRQRREQPRPFYTRWITEDGSAEMLEHVMQRITAEGALFSRDFEYKGPRRGAWWDWKPAKIALEYHLAWGDLMVAGREKFQRKYDLTERVLPDWVERREPSPAERDQRWILQGARSLGVGAPGMLADYTWMYLTPARKAIAELKKEGLLVEITAGLENGGTETMLVHRETLPLLQRATDGALPARRTTFLSPFDSLFWARQRDVKLFGFRQALEAYVPAPKRVWGYFCLPILHKDRLVGRFDPKLERKQKRLHLKALYLEPGIKPDETLVACVAEAMRDFLTFHQANDLSIERSQPESFGKKLLKAL